MTSVLFAQNRTPVPSTEAQVRSTVTVVDNDEAPAVATAAPEFNDAETDGQTGGGLTAHQLGSRVLPSEQYVPHFGNAAENLFAPTNNQISSSGTAAAREAAGVWGHGTLKVVEGIEPTIRDGASLGSDYFVVSERPDAGSATVGGVSPAQPADPDTIAKAQATGVTNSRRAYGAQYASLTETWS